jgi:hypothetical protein
VVCDSFVTVTVMTIRLFGRVFSQHCRRIKKTPQKTQYTALP